MSQRDHAKIVGKLVWRIDAANPAGAFVAANAQERRAVPVIEAHERGWCASSFDLLSGVQVCETDMDSLPGELIDGFLQARE